MNIKIVGDAMVVVSEVNLDTIKKLEKAFPESLILRENDPANNEMIPVFRVCSGKTASFSNNGIAFTGAAAEGKATCTMLLMADTAEKKEQFIKDNLAKGILRMVRLEEQIVGAAEELEATYATAMACVSVE